MTPLDASVRCLWCSRPHPTDESLLLGGLDREGLDPLDGDTKFASVPLMRHKFHGDWNYTIAQSESRWALSGVFGGQLHGTRLFSVTQVRPGRYCLRWLKRRLIGARPWCCLESASECGHGRSGANRTSCSARSQPRATSSTISLREWVDVRHEPRPVRRAHRPADGTTASGSLSGRAGIASVAGRHASLGL